MLTIQQLQDGLETAQRNAAPLRQELRIITDKKNQEIERVFDEFNIKMEQYLDSQLMDSNGEPIRKGDRVKRTKSTYLVTDRYLQIVLGEIVDNPRLVVKRIKSDGNLAKNLFHISRRELLSIETTLIKE